MHPMASLLGIPRELRDQILNLIVQVGAREAPQDASQRTDRTADLRYCGPGGRVLYEQDMPPNRTQTMPTLLVNRQLHSETLNAIALNLKKHEGRPYELDVMLVNGNDLLPTWLYLKEERTKRLDRVCVTIRMEGPREDKQSFLTPEMVWLFYSLLERCLQIGPPALGKKRDCGSDISIQTLELNFTIPDTIRHTLPPEGDYPDGPDDPQIPNRRSLAKYQRVDGIEYYAISAYLLLELIGDHVDYLLRMTHHTAKYGGILFERIGKIRTFWDGNLAQEIDLAEVLHTVQFDNSFGEFPREKRMEVFKKWKINARAKRVEMGLEVHPLEDRVGTKTEA